MHTLIKLEPKLPVKKAQATPKISLKASEARHFQRF